MFTKILILLAWHGLASAGPPVECELYLRGVHQESALRELRHTMFNLPFTHAHSHKLTPNGMRRLGFAEDLLFDVRGRDGLIGQFHQTADDEGTKAPAEFVLYLIDGHGPREVLRREFDDLNPVLWKPSTVAASNHVEAFSMANLDPSPRSGAGRMMAHFPLGFVTDPSVSDGVRSYVRAHYNTDEMVMWIEYGLDVPCTDVGRYVETPAKAAKHWYVLRTVAADYCRVPALWLSNARLSNRWGENH